MDEFDKNNEKYQNFYMNYLISIIEGMRDKGLITEEMYINARNKAYRKYGGNKTY